MAQLSDTRIMRGGATSPYLHAETSEVYLLSGDEGIELRFEIASKGGGTTVVHVKIGSDDFGRILEAMTNSDAVTTMRCLIKETTRHNKLINTRGSYDYGAKNTGIMLRGIVREMTKILNMFVAIFGDLEDSDHKNLEKNYLKANEIVARVLATLAPREERIIRMRFGIGMKNTHSYQEIANQFDTTKYYVIKEEAQALRKLKHPSRSRKLRTLLK